MKAGSLTFNPIELTFLWLVGSVVNVFSGGNSCSSLSHSLSTIARVLTSQTSDSLERSGENTLLYTWPVDLLKAGDELASEDPGLGIDCEEPVRWGAGDSVLLIVIFFSIRFSLWDMKAWLNICFVNLLWDQGMFVSSHILVVYIWVWIGECYTNQGFDPCTN